MKKSAFPAALLLLGVVLGGCPVYDSNDGCSSDVDCPYGSVCDAHTSSCAATPTDSTAVACRRPSDCGTNETCSRFGTCSIGDCHFTSVGCVHGYECSSDSGRWECVPLGSLGEGGNGGAPSAGAPSATSGAPNTSSGAPTSDGGTNAGAGG
jgi:hypothetical protein